jgi:hypothetical protein
MPFNVKKMVAEAQAAAEKWLAEESVESRVRRILHSRLEAISAQLLGFQPPGWGVKSWEIDNCNGRTANTAAGNYIREHAELAVKQALDELVGKLPPLPASAKKSLIRYYHDRVEYEVREELKELAVERAKEMAKRILDDAVEPQ